MAVKFQCPKCERRFVDWGAEKLGYKCPECGDSELVRIGSAEEAPKAAPKLKRKKEPVEVPAEKLPELAADESGLESDDDSVDELDSDGDGDGDGVVDDESLD